MPVDTSPEAVERVAAILSIGPAVTTPADLAHAGLVPKEVWVRPADWPRIRRYIERVAATPPALRPYICGTSSASTASS